MHAHFCILVVMLKVCLATIEPCVFSASASVGALFYFIFKEVIIMFNYDNIGGKIKGLAKGLFIVGAILGGLIVIPMLVMGGKFIIFGFLAGFIVTVIAWVSSWLLYGFGELISLTADNNFRLRSISKGTPNNATDFIGSSNTSNNQSTFNTAGGKNTSDQKKITIDSLMRCPSCGKIILVNSTFCEACGAPINNDK